MAEPASDIGALAKGGRTNVGGFGLRLLARIPFLFIAGRIYGADAVGRFALAVIVVELAALVATFGLKRGLAQAFSTETERPAASVAADALAVSGGVALTLSAILIAAPDIMFADRTTNLTERLFPLIVIAVAWSDVTLAALAYRHDVGATVRARAVVEPWTLSIAAMAFALYDPRNGLILAYVASMAAALVASLIPFFRSYGMPSGWRPEPRRLLTLARANAPLAGADALEWGTRNADRYMLGLIFEPKVVGLYYMAQQIASLPQKLKTSFDPVLGPVITQSLAQGDRAAVAAQVRQVGFWIVAAQTGLAVMGSIPNESVMGLIGPAFVGGAAALSFLLFAEVAASTGAVCESALVYTARHRNLMISIAMLAFQIGFSLALIWAIREAGFPIEWQAAGPAIALMLSLALTSLLKARLLAGVLDAPVSGIRWRLVIAAAAAAAAGGAISVLPTRLEFVEVLVALPVMAVVYFGLLWIWVFRDEDRSLFRKGPIPVAIPASELTR